MTVSSISSYEKFNYLLRPAKQVERKLLVESLHRLRGAGYNIQDYRYIGFGSVYYADFILFHKYLYIDKMVCLESSEIPKRMKFNKPYDFIDLKMSSVTDYIREISTEERVIVWLDYDVILSDVVLEDIESISARLCPGSLLLVTVDVDKKLPKNRIKGKSANLNELRHYYSELANRKLKDADCVKEALPRTVAEIMRNAIEYKCSTRSDVRFWQLYSFCYADNAQMLTLAARGKRFLLGSLV